MSRCIAALLVLAACGDPPADRAPDDTPSRDAAPLPGPDASPAERDASPPQGDTALPTRDPWASGPRLGARRHDDGSIEVRVRAPNATRVDVAFFSAPLGETERLRVTLVAAGDHFEARVPAADLGEASLYYGLRVWGPNWPFDPAWTPGSEAGFIVEIDDDGNRMNPNKLVLDPYALEVTHDPTGPGHEDYGPFRGDEEHRLVDSAPFAPKGIVIDVPERALPGPGRPLRDHIVYEAHLRGLTAGNGSLPVGERGTYAGARHEARRLAMLGVTAIELLPLHETPNDQNDLTADSRGDNYWGYSSLSFFAPDRRYAADRSAGGPTRELRAMIEAFHAEGLEVWLDVVYNHTAEGTGSYLSFRGVDDATYYEHATVALHYVNDNGVGPNFATARPVVADLVIDSLRYYRDQLGIDGFRFDLAPILGNTCERACFDYDARGLLTRIADELGRDEGGGPGAILVAEPWGATEGTYQLGHFPARWAEWNDRYRDAIRRDLNRLGSETVTLRTLVDRITGSADLFDAPSASVDFLTAHDGFTLRDLFAYDAKQNGQDWPYGPSNGGSNGEISSSHGGDNIVQRRAARTALALLAVSHGVPMIVFGDESARTQRGNNNPYNLDSPAMWLDPEAPERERALYTLASRLFAFRHAHAALRPAAYVRPSTDADHDGQPSIAFYDDDGERAGAAYLDATDRHFLSWVLDGDELGDQDAALWVAYNGWSGLVHAAAPPAPPGTAWALAVDTSEAGAAFDFAPEAPRAVDWPYPVEGRALAAFVAKPIEP